MYGKKGRGGEKINILEAGAGTGSAAESILYFFKNFDQKSFEKITYTIVEISPVLCQRITEKLSAEYPTLFENNQIKIINDDIMNFKTRELSYVMFF